MATIRSLRDVRALPRQLPANAKIYLASPDEHLEALTAWLSKNPQPGVKRLTFGKAKFDSQRDTFPELANLDEAQSRAFFGAFPNLGVLKVQGHGLFDTLLHSTVRQMTIVGCPSPNLGLNSPDPNHMSFPQLETLVWTDEEDGEGMSCFEGDGLSWALDRRNTPKLRVIEATDATTAQLCETSVPVDIDNPFERIRLKNIRDIDFRVRTRTLEVIHGDQESIKHFEANPAELAETFGMRIVWVKPDGMTVLLAAPSNKRKPAKKK